MKRRRVAIPGFVVVALVFALGCGEDHSVAPPQDTVVVLPPLSERGDALKAVVGALNALDDSVYIDLLDPNFRYGFHSTGKWAVAWNYEKEVAGTRELLGGGGGDYADPVVAIEFEVVGIDDAEWSEVPPQTLHPDASWWVTVLEYHFRVETSRGMVYAPRETLHSEFIVSPDGGRWRLARWRDFGPNPLSTVAVAETSWPMVVQPYR